MENDNIAVQEEVDTSENSVENEMESKCNVIDDDEESDDEDARPMSERWLESCPYNVFFTPYVKGNDISKNLWIQFDDLLDPSLGNVEGTFATNFHTSYSWLYTKYKRRGLEGKPLTLISHHIDKGPDAITLPSWTEYEIPMPKFGTHQAKVMIFAYDDGSIRVVVLSANFFSYEWKSYVNCVWISPKCMPLKDASSSGDSITNFKSDLINYLEGYQLDIVNPWIEKVKGCDLSHIKAFFIGSVPGEHKSDSKFGFFGVKQALARYAAAPDDNKYRILAMCSVLGSLGYKKESNYLNNEFTEVFSANRDNNWNKPDVSIIYPCMKDVLKSKYSLDGGSSIMYSSRFHSRQEWIVSHMNKWKMDTYDRSFALPHHKVYTRISDDYKKISYCIIASHNLSKSGWGTYESSSVLWIRSFEAAVLLLPQLLVDRDYFPLTEDEDGGRVPKFYLPYDLPLVPYEENDLPYFYNIGVSTVDSVIQLYLQSVKNSEKSDQNDGKQDEKDNRDVSTKGDS